MSIWSRSDLCSMGKEAAQLHQAGQCSLRQQGLRSNSLFPQVSDCLVTQCLAGCVA